MPGPTFTQSTALQRPKHWSRPNRTPLNTRPASPSSGAYYKVLFGSPRGSARRITANQNSTGDAMFVTPWTDAIRFETDVLGNSTYVPGLKYLQRRTPLRHGDPAQQTLFLDSLQVISQHNFEKAYHEVMTVSDGTYSAGWSKTEMVAYSGMFSQRPYIIAEDADVSSATVPELKRYVTKFPTTDGFHRKIPGWGVAFDDNVQNHVTTLGSLPEYYQRWVYTTYFWPIAYYGEQMFSAGNCIPLDYMNRTLGKVNAEVFDTDLAFTKPDGTIQYGFPAEELKYEDHLLSQPYFGSDDKLYCDIQHVFLWNPRNWNKQLDPNKDPTATTGSYVGGYQYVKFKNASNQFFSPARRPFISADFNKLFKPRGAT